MSVRSLILPFPVSLSILIPIKNFQLLVCLLTDIVPNLRCDGYLHVTYLSDNPHIKILCAFKAFGKYVIIRNNLFFRRVLFEKVQHYIIGSCNDRDNSPDGMSL